MPDPSENATPSFCPSGLKKAREKRSFDLKGSPRAFKTPEFRDLCCQQQDQRAAFFCWMTFVSWWMKLEGS